MQSSRTFCALISGAVLFVACGESKRPEGDSATTGSAAIDEIVNAYCATVRTCCRAAGFPPEPVANCEAEFSQIDTFQAVLAGKTVLREPERSQCVSWIEGLASSCIVTDDSPCRRIFDGTGAEGAPCEDPSECRTPRDGVVCLRAGDTGTTPPPGVCRALTVGQLGSPCARTIDQDEYRFGYSTSELAPNLGVCDRRDGLFCDYVTSSCQPLRAAGEACDFEGCADGLYCDGTCRPKTPAGTACEVYDQCQAGLDCVGAVCASPKLTDGDLCEGDFD
jgi:hypothetical protein